MVSVGEIRKAIDEILDLVSDIEGSRRWGLDTDCGGEEVLVNKAIKILAEHGLIDKDRVMKHKTIEIFEDDLKVLNDTTRKLGVDSMDILIKNTIAFMSDLSARVIREEKLDTETIKDMLLYWGLIK